MGKLIHIGLNKAGSTSLAKAMEILGFRSLHHCCGDQRILDIVHDNQKNRRRLLWGLEDYDFISDFGGHNFFEALDAQYPRSKFILTLRDEKNWVKSRIRQQTRLQVTGRRPAGTRKRGQN